MITTWIDSLPIMAVQPVSISTIKKGDPAPWRRWIRAGSAGPEHDSQDQLTCILGEIFQLL
jgi:hypothetical protein